MIFSSLFRAAPRNAHSEKESYFQLVTNSELFTPPKADARKLLQTYSKHPWTRAVLAKIAQGVARQAWYLEDSRGERINEHPALDFLRAGSPRLRGVASIAVATTQLNLTAESFWVIGREGNAPNGRPIMFAPLPSPMVQDIPDDDNGHYDIVPKRGELLRIRGRDVIYFKDADPLEPFERGTSIAGAAHTETLTDEASSDYLYSFLKNRARPDIIITGSKDAPINANDLPRLQESWMQKFRGAAKAGRPFFGTGPLEIKLLGEGLRNNEFSEIRAQLKQVFTEVYGVPPEIMGRLQNSNRATIDSADYLFAKHVIEPRLAFMRDVLEPWLRAEFGLAGLKLRYESPVAEDKAHALAVTTAHARYFTGNEVRALAGHKPLPGLDDLPPEPEPPEPGNDNDNDDGDDEPPTKPGKKDDKKSQPIEDTAKKSAECPASTRLKKPVTKTLNPEGVVRVSGIFEDPNVRAEINRFVDDVLGELLEKYGADLLATLEAGASFEINGRIVDWLLREVPGLVGQVDATTRDALRASLVEGIATDEAVELLVARVEQVFADAAEWRAPLIGQTVATKLTGFGSLEAATQAGFEAKRWLSTQDQVVRGTHAALNGQTKLLSEKFQSPSGAQAAHPGAFGVASEDANCRCAMRPVLDGEKAVDKSDVAFLRFHERASAAIAEKVAATIKNVFEAQKSLVLNEIRVLTGVA